MKITPVAAPALGLAALLALTACATDADGDSDSPSAAASAGASADAHPEHEGEGHDTEGATGSAQEASSRTPRIVGTYDGGVVVLDAHTLEVEGDMAIDGFNRVSPAGDGRHVAVSTEGGWAILDAGTWSQGHGDHDHYFTAEPALTDLFIEAETPGHVTPHDGLTALWDDGTGNVLVVETSEWTDVVEHEHPHVMREWSAAEAHHGVAVAEEGGDMWATRGNDEERSGAMLLDGQGNEVVVSDDCPAVHGQTAVETSDGTELVLFGCGDGVLVFHGDHAHKIAGQTDGDVARTGNLHAVDGHDIVLGDLKTDSEGGLGLSEIVLIDPAAETLEVVDPFQGADALYTWRGQARGDDGEVLTLGTDGVLRTMDPATGEQTVEVQVIDAWEVPEEWQTAHPSVQVVDGMAYVNDPAAQSVHIVDYVTGEIWKSVEVGYALNEVTSVTG
ncbi:hypothetical protein [Demequina globuliformis]|uniref:hypothetical protein n=1 Tax=Demequina globuliformis TaxID=676202 RepID=UPI000781F63E|nr:hypothetical protein [Demequina globuliformis]